MSRVQLRIYGVDPMVDKRLSVECLSGKTPENRWESMQSQLKPRAYTAIREVAERYDVTITATGSEIIVSYRRDAIASGDIGAIERRLRAGAPPPKACVQEPKYVYVA